MVLSELGWFNGITALISMLLSLVIGIIFMYKSKKLGAKLLMIAGVMVITISGLYLGVSFDFLSYILTDTNMNNAFGLRGIMSYIWVPLIIILALYLGTTIMEIKKKWLILGIYIGLAVVYEYFLIFHANESFDFAYAANELIDTSFNDLYPTFILIVVFLLSGFILDGIGFLIKAKQAVGVLRKKFIYLSFGTTIFVVCGAIESLFSLPVILVVVRSGMISSAFLFYFGLKA
jgi:hypothetical protein